MTDIVDVDTLTIAELKELRDACSQRLMHLRYTGRQSLPELLGLLEELKMTLDNQGKQWRSLERWQWMEGQIRFWLNPTDQENYKPGWYTIEDLIAWSQDRGPVLVELEPEPDEDDWTSVDGVRIRWLPDGTMERRS